MDPGLLARARAFVAAASAGAALAMAPAQGIPTSAPNRELVGVSAASPVTGVVARAVELVKALCRRFEGFMARPYLCPAGVWTIGYGATTYLDGRGVKPGDPAISEAAADRLLERQILTVYMPGTQILCPTADTPELLAALTDFSFNLGLTRLKGSTLRKRVLARDWAGAQVELRKWNRGGGKILPGLVARREAECRLISVPSDSPSR